MDKSHFCEHLKNPMLVFRRRKLKVAFIEQIVFEVSFGQVSVNDWHNRVELEQRCLNHFFVNHSQRNGKVEPDFDGVSVENQLVVEETDFQVDSLVTMDESKSQIVRF